MNPRVKIIIPEFGQRHHTQNCLDSIDRQVGIDIAEVVVGNDGYKKSQPELACETQLRVRDWQDNVLYAENVNRTAGYAFRNGLQDQDIIIISNNDVIFDSNCIDELSRIILQKKGLHGTLITNAPWWKQDVTNSQQCDKYTETEVISGCCIGMLAQKWFDLGGIDSESFRSYYEESDLCRRALFLGLSVGFTHRVKLEHIGGQTYLPLQNIEKCKKLFKDSCSNYKKKWYGEGEPDLKYRGPGYSRIEE